MQKQIDEVMDLVEKYGHHVVKLNEAKSNADIANALSVTDENMNLIESKLRELLPVWQPIETAPQKVAILVKGGVWMGEIGDPSENCIALVEYDGFRFDECGGDYYSSWIQGPTHWKPVEL